MYNNNRLQRAMTMTSGAVFFDTDVEKQDCNIEVQDGSNKRSSLIEKEREEEEKEERKKQQADGVTEDALMKQVFMATQRKTELLNSVKKLNEQDNEESRSGETSDSDIEFNLRPSTLRRLSKTSQILHLENIAKMKKRRSQTDFDTPMESSPAESDNEMEGDTTTSSQQQQQRKISKVSGMTEVFVRRSKNNVREYTRRRTLDNYPSKEEGFSKSVLFDDDEDEDVTLNENERSFHSMEVDVSDLVQRHHQMIRDKTSDTPRSALQRHKSFPSADRRHHGGKAVTVGVDEAVSEKNVPVVKSIVGSFESKKDDVIKTLKVEERKEMKRPCSLNMESENISSEVVMGRRRASTDVDLRSKSSS